MKAISLIASALAAIPIALFAQSPTQYLEEAQKQAAEQKKDLLMIFSGSSWNSRSQKFETEVLNTEEFKTAASENFVSLVFDFPAKREDAHGDLIILQQKYRFTQMPSVVLADVMGRPYAYTGPLDGNVADHLKHLSELQAIRVERDRLFGEAEKTKGVERAKLLVKALKSLPQTIVRDFYDVELADIAESDSQGVTGYVAEIQKADALRKEQERFEYHFRNKDYDRILAESKEEASKAEGEDAQRILLYGIRALADQQKFEEAKKAVEEMAKIAPESELGKNAPRYLDMLKSAQERQAKMAENVGKNEPKRPVGPIVSKPVAIVTDIEELRKDARAIDAELVAAQMREKELQEVVAAGSKKIATLEEELKKARSQEKKVAGDLKEAAEASERLTRKSQVMKEVIENHEAMEKRKRAIEELEKKASELQEQAEKLRQQGSEIKKGKE